MVAQPAFQPSSVELTQRNQGNLRLKPRPVPQEPVQEDLTGVTDIHLFEPLIQGRDEHGSPEQVDGAEALAVPQQPVGERLAGPVISSTLPGTPGHKPRAACRRHSRNLAARKLPARWKRGRPDARPGTVRFDRRDQERPAPARGGASSRSRPAGRNQPGLCNKPC